MFPLTNDLKEQDDPFDLTVAPFPIKPKRHFVSLNALQ
jgi:hypothetical protein